MKYLSKFSVILILLVLLSTNVFGKNNKVNKFMLIDKLNSEAVIEVDADIDTIKTKLVEWIQINFNDEDDSITEESDTVIKGKGSLLLPLRGRLTRFYFNYRIDIKDKKFKIQFENIYLKMIHDGGIGKQYLDSFAVKNIIVKNLNKEKFHLQLTNFILGIDEEDNSDW